jgi:hypothetical protein
MIITCVRCAKKFDKNEMINLKANEYSKYNNKNDNLRNGCFMLFIYKK